MASADRRCDDYANWREVEVWFGIIGNGLIDENLPLLIHDADLDRGGVVVKTDENC